METKKKLFYLAFHTILGALIFMVPLLVYPVFILFLIYGTYLIAKNPNSNLPTIACLCYATGLEVLFRMKSNGSFYDIGKYAIIYFCFIGFYFRKFSFNTWPFLLVLVLFSPAIVITFNTFINDINLKQKIFFNLLGPIALVFSSMYCYQKAVTFKELNNLLFVIAGPLISILVNIFFYSNPSTDVFTDTNSNFATSGGFGPNQMSVILGLGAFLFFIFFTFNNNNKLFSVILFFLFIIFTYRGIITFSRGGIITAGIMLLTFIYFLFKKINSNAKTKLFLYFGSTIFLMLLIWVFSTIATNGLITKRYTNKDAAGRIKESKLTGREDIMASDLNLFLEHPFLGVGVGLSSASRSQIGLEGTQAHSEPTRLLAEHGLLGLIILLVLIVMPLSYNYKLHHNNNLYFISFFIFWLLTINHAATRIVAPSVLYAFCFLNVKFNDEES